MFYEAGFSTGFLQVGAQLRALLIICWLGIKKSSSKCNGFPTEVCVFQNKLMAIKCTKMRKRKFEPRTGVWKPKEDNIREEFTSLECSEFEAKGQGCFSTNDRREFMKGTMISAAERVCGRTKEPKRYKET